MGVIIALLLVLLLMMVALISYCIGYSVKAAEVIRDLKERGWTIAPDRVK